MISYFREHGSGTFINFKINKGEKMKKSWSRAHKKCKACKSTKNKHSSKGLCVLCYAKKWKKEHPDTCQTYMKKYYLENKTGYIKRISDKKAASALYNKRLLNALRKNGYSDKRIVNFFGIKIK